MADAVLTQRLLVGGTALCLLFLVVLFLVGAFVLLAKVVDRFRKADAKVQEILASARTEAAPVPAALDVEPGINLAARDECELLYSLPARHPGLDRIRQAIRDEQQKGD